MQRFHGARLALQVDNRGYTWGPGVTGKYVSEIDIQSREIVNTKGILVMAITATVDLMRGLLDVVPGGEYRQFGLERKPK